MKPLAFIDVSRLLMAGVPATSEVALLGGAPLTRSGGLLAKKSLPAATAEAP